MLVEIRSALVVYFNLVWKFPQLKVQPGQMLNSPDKVDPALCWESEETLLKPATRRTIGFDQGERQQHGEKQEEDNCRSSQQFLHLLVAFPFFKVSASFLFSFALLPQRVITKVTITEFLRIGDQKAHLSLLPLCSQCHFYHFLESALMVGNRQNWSDNVNHTIVQASA